jgi:hypothetical protein
MTISRISLGLLASALVALGAQAQTDDSGNATAPPRTLGQPLPPVEQQEAPPPDQSDPASPPAATGDNDHDVDTSDLKSDVPEQAPRPEHAPRRSAPPPPPAEAEPLPPPEPPKPTIQVQTLGVVEGPAQGLVDATDGGFDQNIWTGSSRADIETLLPHLPLASPDTAVRALSRKLILTRADAPPGKVKRAFITLRIEKLMDAGMADEAGALAASASVKDDPDFAQVQANAILAAGRATEACGNATASRLNQDSQFWLELRAYCAAQSGDAATADLTRGILDAKGLSDPAFAVLVDDVLTKAKKPPPKIAKPTALHLFLLRKVGLPIPPEVAGHFGVHVALLVMRDAHETPADRLVAAERVVKTGAATTAELKAVLDAQTIAPGAQANVAKMPFLTAQAALRRAALLESRPPVKAQLVHDALIIGDKAGMFEIAAHLQTDAVEKLDPNTVPAEKRPLIGWALLLAGKHETAARWLGDGDAPRAVQALVAGKDAAPADLSSIARRAIAPDKAQDPNRAFDALVLGVYDVLGRTMPPDAKQAASTVAAHHWPGRRPDDAVMRTILDAASAPDRRGEAVLRILDAIGPDGPRDLAPDVTVEFLRALQDMGRQDSARALAIHALLLYRPGTT